MKEALKLLRGRKKILEENIELIADVIEKESKCLEKSLNQRVRWEDELEHIDKEIEQLSKVGPILINIGEKEARELAGLQNTLRESKSV